MRTIFAGSRHLSSKTALTLVTIAQHEATWEITHVLHGDCRGVDKVSESLGLPTTVYPADWKTHGKAAGPIRNQIMVDNADALIAIWDGKSRGTLDIIKRARKARLKVLVKRIDGMT